MATIRKKVLEKKKRARRNKEGTPRASTMRRFARKQMKEFNNYIKRKFLEGKLNTHQQAGLPEELTGLDLSNFYNQEEIKEDELAK